MALSRKAKIWMWVLGTPVVLLVCAGIAAKLYFTDARLRNLLLPRIEQAIHRPVSVGSVNLSLLPALGVSIDSLTIANAPGEGFSATPFLALDRLSVSVRIMPLFKGAVEVSSVELDRPRLLVEVNEEGQSNYADMTAAPPPAPGENTQQPSRGGTAFLVSGFRIVDGAVTYIDRKANRVLSLEGLRHTMQMEMLPATGIRLDGQSSVDRFSYGSTTATLIDHLRMTLDLELAYDPVRDTLGVRKGVLGIQDMALRVSGSIASASTLPMLNVHIESSTLNIAELLSLVPKEYMKKAEGVKGTGTAVVRLAVTGPMSDSTQPDIMGTIEATNATIHYPQLPKPVTDITIHSSFMRSRAKQEFRLEKCSASLGTNPVRVTLLLENFDNPTIAMSLYASMNLGEVKDYYPLEPGTDMRGTLSANVTIDGKVKDPMTMKAAGSMEFRGVTVKTPTARKAVENLQGMITFNNQIVEARRVSMTLGKSDLVLAFWLKDYLSLMSTDAAAPQPKANLTLTSSHLYTADIMTDSARTAPPGAQPAGTPPAPRRAPQRSLVLPNLDMDIAATIGTLTMERFEFSNVRATMRVSKGVITMQNFSLNAFDGSVISKGTLDLRAPQQPLFDLALDVKRVEAHAMLPKFTTFGERIYGRLTMNTTMKGALDDTLGLIAKTLTGRGDVEMENGRLTGVSVNKAVATFLKLPDLENITFKNWSNSFTISEGRIVVKDLTINALDADYVVNGSQGIDGTLDYAMTLLLPEKTSGRIAVPGFAGEALNLFKDNTGRVKLDFTVTGTSENPSVALDTKAARTKAEDMVKQKVADEAKKLGEQAKKKGEDLLKDIFKRKK
jgi:uncharacterized protein involved in outer membrane biogenesis